MAEYIDRSAVVSALISVENRYNRNRDHENVSAEALYKDLCDAEIEIGKIPAAEVALVVHGRWKYYHKQGIAVCTSCSFERKLDDNFGRAISCPNCGAVMGGDDTIGK